MKKLILFMMFLQTIVCAAQEDSLKTLKPVNLNPSFRSFMSFGAGDAYNGNPSLFLKGSLNLHFRQNAFSLQYAYLKAGRSLVGDLFDDGKYEEPQYYNARIASLMYGLNNYNLFEELRHVASVSVGVSVMQGYKRGNLINTSGIPAYKKVDFRAIGFVTEVSYVFALFKVYGLGVTATADINSEQPMYGLLLTSNLGQFW